MHLLFFILISHELLHKVEITKNAVVIDFYFADGSVFSYEEYKVFRPGNNKIPFVIGRTDARGRLVFLPDTQGTWLVKTWSNTGHGAEIRVNIHKNVESSINNNAMLYNIFRFITGILIIFLVFFLLSKTQKRRK